MKRTIDINSIPSFFQKTNESKSSDLYSGTERFVPECIQNIRYALVRYLKS